MKNIIDILNEAYKPKLGKIRDLNRIKYIRHYTTMEGLAGMLSNGYIFPHESKGDMDWRRYEIYGNSVVSFHDARYDPEWDELNEANRVGSTLAHTKTLGIHMDDICACIEYDFSELPEDIQNSCGIINILNTYLRDFFFTWNECINIAKMIHTSEDILVHCPDAVYNDWYDADDQDKWIKNMYSFLLRLRKVKFTKEDCKDLLDYAIHRQTQKLMNKLLKIGWAKDDEKNPLYIYYNDLFKTLTGEPVGSSAKTDFLNYIAKHIVKTNKDKINIEIRFDTEIPLKYAKRIILFDGIVDNIVSWGYLKDADLIDNINELIEINKDNYNIERIPVDEIAKKLR